MKAWNGGVKLPRVVGSKREVGHLEHLVHKLSFRCLTLEVYKKTQERLNIGLFGLRSRCAPLGLFR